ncbi:MAG: gluconate permease [Planctomycetes bacterium]|nr:gluconate permease [Planctomycetota bacterium]
MVHPLLILALGIFCIIFMIAVLRLNAFLALIVSAILVSLLAPGETPEKISRVATAFGGTVGNIGIVIALAVVIGKCMMDSGAADRIVRAFLRLLGEKRSAWALTTSGFVLSIPVFFDTVFYLLVPLARSMHRRTGRNYLKYCLAIAAGGVITHSIVPPTPGPLVMAEQLGIDLGVMILFATIIAVPPAFVGMAIASWMDRRMKIPMRPIGGGMQEPEPLPDSQLPGLMASLLPIVLPVLLVSLNTAVSAVAKRDGQPAAVASSTGRPAAAVASGVASDVGRPTEQAAQPPDAPRFWQRAAGIMAILGNPNFAMLLSAAIAMAVLKMQRGLTKARMADLIDTSLMSGGIIILITAAGGAFGAMLKAARIGPAIEGLFQSGTGQQAGGIMFLVIGVVIASIMKIAQGSGTVAMTTASAMVAAMIPSLDSLGYPPVLLATAIGGGSMMGSWMNDSGFWVFVKMTGLTEAEGLKSWLPLVALTGFSCSLVSFVLALTWQAPPHVRIWFWVLLVLVLGLAVVLPGRLGVRRET